MSTWGVKQPNMWIYAARKPMGMKNNQQRELQGMKMHKHMDRIADLRIWVPLSAKTETHMGKIIEFALDDLGEAVLDLQD